MNKFTVAKWLVVPVVAIASYFGALQYWNWKWDTPNQPLPAAHLEKQDFMAHDPDTRNWAESAQSSLVNLAEKLQSVSMSGAMSVDGELVWSGAVGLAHVEPLSPATRSTQYRIGSVSKAITSVALMRMVEEGLLSLDAPIHDYLPEYPRYARPLTVRHLASHMGGVRHYKFVPANFPPTDGLSDLAYRDAIAALDQFRNDALLFEPGQDFAYSTHGYTLLSAVMQAAGGKKFETLLADYVTEPLGLSQTAAEHLLDSESALAGFYNSDDGLYGETPFQNLSNKVAGGGLVSTPTELVILGSALLNNKLVSPRSFEQMTRVQSMPDGSENPQYYGLGWRHYETSRIIDENHKVDIVHHGGVAVGANAFLMLVPDHNISIAIATNGKGEKSRGEIQLLAYQLAGMVIKQQQEDTTLSANR